MITLDDYYMGRDALYPDLLTIALQNNANETIERWNTYLSIAALNGIIPGIDPDTNTSVSSGWRPPAVNDSTSNAAANSKHVTCQALDVRDTPNRDLARWVLANLAQAISIGIWFEDFRWTPTWVHGQTVAPGSGNRIFIPSLKPPLVPPLPGQL